VKKFKYHRNKKNKKESANKFISCLLDTKIIQDIMKDNGKVNIE